MKTVGILQARMGSSRLPGKVLEKVGDASMLAQVVRRLGRVRGLTEAVVATTTEPADEPVLAECSTLGVAVFRGSEDDVLDRYYQAARATAADVVVRITSDSPLLDPEVVDLVIERFHAEHPDYASNGLVATFPRGLDAEVLTMDALGRAWREAAAPYQRAHVTAYVYEHPELFRLLSVESGEDHGTERWTVDTPEDLELVRQIYRRLDPTGRFGWRAVLSLLDTHPELRALNRHVAQKALDEG